MGSSAPGPRPLPREPCVPLLREAGQPLLLLAAALLVLPLAVEPPCELPPAPGAHTGRRNVR